MSIEYRGDNKWRFRIRFEGRNYSLKYFSEKPPKLDKNRKLPVDKNGETIYPADVKREHSAFVVDVQRGQIGLNGNMTFKEFCELYIGEHLKTREESTYINNVKVINKHLIPEFGNLKLNGIKTIDVQLFVNKKMNEDNSKDKSKKLSAITVVSYFKILNIILNKAVTWDMIEKNPCNNIVLPKVTKRNLTQIYSLEQLRTLINGINNLDNLMHKAFLSLALFGGFRKGEITAITLDDIDFHNNSVRINKQVAVFAEDDKIIYQIKNRTKSRNSMRTTYLPDFAMKNVKEYINSMPHLFNKFLFWNFETKKLYHVNSFNKMFNKFLQRNNLPHIKLHDLRHLCATMQANNNIDIVKIASNLGDSIKTINDVYIHDIEESRKESANSMNAYIEKIAK